MNPSLNWKKILDGFSLTDKEYYLDRDDAEVVVVLAGSGVPYVRGRSSGPSEKCFPSEGGHVEDVMVFDPETGEEVELTSEELDRASDHLWQMVCSDDDDSYAAAADRAYDEWKDRQMEERY